MTANDPSAATRARGQIVVARALWYTKPGQGELRSERLPALRPGEARVRTLFSLISRGTERLVAHGEVPQSEWTTMRAPMQVGAFPFPVKYGYSATGVVTAGRQDLVGSTIFCLHPHQDHFLAPEATLLAVPGDVPARRAILAANMETALNAHWDAGVTPGDRILVVGAGIVGLLTAHLARRIAGADVVICDIDPGRGELAARLGIAFASSSDLPRDNRIVFHASDTAAGLQTAIDHTAFEGRIIEMSWYGQKPVQVNLGGSFHSRRLQLISSQVGHVSPTHRSTVSHTQRLGTALALLNDPALDHLVAQDIAFESVPERLTEIFGTSTSQPVSVIAYAPER